MSPHQSSYTGKREDIFDLLETDIANYSQEGNCILCGDFNARTNTANDYLDYNTISEKWDETFLSISNRSSCDSDNLTTRSSLDNKNIDKYGEKLLELCKVSDLRIVNGRVLGDKLGNFTL